MIRSACGLLALLICLGCQTASISHHAAGVSPQDAYTLQGPAHFRSGFPARAPQGRVQAVIEIPAGDLDKWEIGPDGLLHWEMKNGKPRVVQYLGYPGNYGMVPQTLEAKEEGGDGDPMDILVLGSPRLRGTVMAVRVIGALRMLDGGEEDSKLIGVDPEGPFATVSSITELDTRFPGVTAIIETWFANYKGPGKIRTQGFAGPEEAETRLNRAIEAWRRYGL